MSIKKVQLEVCCFLVSFPLYFLCVYEYMYFHLHISPLCLFTSYLLTVSFSCLFNTNGKSR